MHIDASDESRSAGIGVDRDAALAVRAYEDSVKRGELSSSVQLGHMYARRCAEGPEGAAIEAYQRAADQGHPDAQVALSDLLRDGHGAPPNPLQAYLWARLAEERLPAGPLKTLATARAKAAAALLPQVVRDSEENMIRSMIATSAKPFR